MAATLYKARGVPAKRAVCAICVERTRGRTELIDLGRGVTVWLCPDHAGDDFRTRRSGRDFALTLQRLWSAHGCLTRTRSRALDDHLEALRGSGPPGRSRPGSYSWRSLRREAEARFAAGEPTTQVIAELRARHRDDYANVPSIRTMRRWYTQRRWLHVGVDQPESSSKGTNEAPPPARSAPPAAAPPADSPAARWIDRAAGLPLGRQHTGQVAITPSTTPEPPERDVQSGNRPSSSRPPPDQG